MVSQLIAREKLDQAVMVLNELDIDLWLTFCRESAIVPDPVMDLIVGQGACWLSAFFVARNGDTTVLVGEADAADFELSGLYENVRTYSTDVSIELRDIIHHYNPRSIALNYSESNYAADGLSLGLFRQIEKALAGTPYQQHLVSAEDIIARVRGRKSPEEIRRLRCAAEMAAVCWDQAIDRIRIGMSEIRIAALFEEIITGLGGSPSFGTIVNAGSKTKPGHSSPTQTLLEPGDLLHVDFGVRYQGYCSDIQRLIYFRRPQDNGPPAALSQAFSTVRDIIAEAVTLYRPGAAGHEIDALARRRLTTAGYPEFNHGLGHQIGQAVHDGGAIVGPLWPRYGNLGTIPLEENNVFTAEFGISLDGIGHVSLEEDVLVTGQGGMLLCRPQLELVVR
jgi:Xaa-Pro aminopeptidase